MHRLLKYCRLTPSAPAVLTCGCSKGSAPYWSNPLFLIFGIRALWCSFLSARVPECQKLKMVGWTSMAKCRVLTGSAVKGLICVQKYLIERECCAWKSHCHTGELVIQSVVHVAVRQDWPHSGHAWILLPLTLLSLENRLNTQWEYKRGTGWQTGSYSRPTATSSVLPDNEHCY